MAAIPVVFNGVDGNGNPVTLIGSLAYSDRGVGGGPIIPDRPIDPGAHPEHPIVLPKPPQVPPPSIWPPGPGIDFPSHPIVLPDPGDPVIPPGTLITWKAVWSEDSGWQVVGVPNVPHPAPA